MAINIETKSATVRPQNKCIMCDGTMEKSNTGFICNTCRDKMRK